VSSLLLLPSEKCKLKLLGFLYRFKKARTIAPLYTAGAVAVTSDGKRLVSCVGEEMLLTDVESGEEICRFVGVGSFFCCFFFFFGVYA
jgi:hypothetical protein